MVSSPFSLNVFKPRVFVVEQLATLVGSGQIAQAAVASGAFTVTPFAQSSPGTTTALPFDTKQLFKIVHEPPTGVAVGDTRITHSTLIWMARLANDKPPVAFR